MDRLPVTQPASVRPKATGSLVAKLGPQDLPLVMEAANWRSARQEAGFMANSGCSFGALASVRFGAVHDMVHLAHGPFGCGHYAQSGRYRALGGVDGVNVFGALHTTTDFRESDIVFGGDAKLARAINEIASLFPLAQGTSVLAECPVGLIGDDIQAVAKAQSQKIGKPIVPVRCEGFRGSFDLWMRDMVAGWDIIAKHIPALEPVQTHDVSLICFSPENVFAVRQLLEAIGLRVVAQWVGHGSAAEIARLAHSRLVVVANLGAAQCDWVEALHARSGVPWLQAGFVSPAQTDAALRAIAAHFDATIQERAEAVIAAQAPRVAACLARYRPRLEGKLYFSFGTFSAHTPEPYQLLGLRVGTAYQGWPEMDGTWRTLAKPYRYRALTDDAVSSILREAKPDIIAGAGHDEWFLRKCGLQTVDMFSRGGRHASWGYDGFIRFAADLDRIANATWMRLAKTPFGSVAR